MRRRARPLVALGGGAVLAALAIVSSTGRADASVTRHVLPNGVRVLVREDRSAHVLAVGLHVDARSRDETEERAGITNLLHRVMIRGAARRSASQLAEAIEDLGGGIQASGGVDHAEIVAWALARHWDALLTIVAEVALQPTLPDDELERERKLALSRIQSREDNPFQFAVDTLTADLYGQHPYALPADGRRQSVTRITRDALIAHHRALYRPHRLVIAVSGDVARDKVLKLVERRFGQLAAVGAPDVPSRPAPTPTGARRAVEKPAQQTQILVGHLGPSLLDPDFAATKVLNAVLGGGISGRLFSELRERRGLAYAVGVLHPWRAGPAPIVAYLGTAPASAGTAETALSREIDRMRDEPPTEDEIARAKGYVQGTLAMDRRTNNRHAWHLGFFESVGAGGDFSERYARAVAAVTSADVAAAAARYLRAPTTVVLAPPR